MDKELNAYVRIDGSGRLVPNTLILRKHKPKFGKWMEVDINIWRCCEPTTTTTSTTVAASTTTTSTTAEPICMTYTAHGSIVARVALWYRDCDGEEHVVNIDGNDPYTFCATAYGIASPGWVELISEECLITTTTVEPTTTSTTTEEETTTTTTTSPI